MCLYEEESQACQDEGNHHGAEQDSLSLQERFEWKETIFTQSLKKYGGYMPSSFSSRSFSVVRLVEWQVDEIFIGLLKKQNPATWFVSGNLNGFSIVNIVPIDPCHSLVTF